MSLSIKIPKRIRWDLGCRRLIDEIGSFFFMIAKIKIRSDLFHEEIMKLADNDYLFNAHKTIKTKVDALRYGALSRVDIIDSSESHKKLMNLISQKKINEAVEFLTKHINESLKDFLKSIAK